VIRRREFIVLLGGAASWPLAARAQQGERMRRVGALMNLATDDPMGQVRVAAFVQGLQAAGWWDGRNVRIDTRWAGADPANYRKYAAELIALGPDVVLASTTAAVAQLQQASRTVPIVFVGAIDPVGSGLVTSMARPGGNVTGFVIFEYALAAKWLELLKEIAPGVRRATLLFGPDTSPYYPVFLREFGAGLAPLALEVSATAVRDEAEIEATITAFARGSASGLIAAPDAVVNTRRRLIMSLAERHRLPAIYGFRRFVTEGGLISYGPDSIDIVRRSASYVDRILRGEKPADLPVQAPTKYELAINLRTAKALGLDVPATLIATADEVIE